MMAPRVGTLPPSSRSSAMDEHRASRRQRVLKSRKVIYANGSIVIGATIRNISETGAQLRVPTTVGNPDQFECGHCRVAQGRSDRHPLRVAAANILEHLSVQLSEESWAFVLAF